MTLGRNCAGSTACGWGVVTGHHAGDTPTAPHDRLEVFTEQLFTAHLCLSHPGVLCVCIALPLEQVFSTCGACLLVRRDVGRRNVRGREEGSGREEGREVGGRRGGKWEGGEDVEGRRDVRGRRNVGGRRDVRGRMWEGGEDVGGRRDVRGKRDVGGRRDVRGRADVGGKWEGGEGVENNT